MLGTQLQHLRTRAKLSRKELAEKLRKDISTIGNWENDESMPSVDILIALADFFDVSLDYLVGRREGGRFEGDFVEVTGLSPEQIANVRFLVEQMLR